MTTTSYTDDYWYDDQAFLSPDRFRGQTFGIYPRVSSVRQAEENRESLDAQIEACREYGESLGMVLDPVCVQKEAHTSTTTERPKLNQLLKDMKARGVKNLVIDRVDRLTREGQRAAHELLGRFDAADITLHIAVYRMTISNEMELGQFMQMVTAAKMANDARVRAKMEAQRYAAKTKNRALKGNRAPYGFVYETLEEDRHGRPTKYRLVADRRVVNGYAAWDVRKRICLDYLSGATEWAIANRLTADGVPTSRTIVGHKNATPYWTVSVVDDILKSPLNYGDATTFRKRSVIAPPDARHPTKWKKQVDVPPEKQIPITGYVKDPVITREEADAIRARLNLARKRSPRGATLAEHAMLRGGMATCGLCDKSLRVKWSHGKVSNMRYVCHIHEAMPHRCPGVSVSARLLDTSVWLHVMFYVFTPGALQALIETQMRREAEGISDPVSRFEELKRVKANLERRAKNLVDDISETDEKDLRALKNITLKEIESSIKDVNEDLVNAERLAADETRRQHAVANVEQQRARHYTRVALLTLALFKLNWVKTPQDVTGAFAELIRWFAGDTAGERFEFVDETPLPVIRSMRTICQSLGVEVSVPAEGKAPFITFNLGSATMQPWFPADAAEVEPGGVTLSDSY